MRKALSVLAAAATITVASLATTTSADAQYRWRGGWRGPAFWGGLTAGAIIGGALAAPYGYYGYPRSYAYYGGEPYYAGGYGGYGYAAYGDSYAYVGGPYYVATSCIQRSWNGYRWVRYSYAC
jgi:hypothetical protein